MVCETDAEETLNIMPDALEITYIGDGISPKPGTSSDIL